MLPIKNSSFIYAGSMMNDHGKTTWKIDKKSKSIKYNNSNKYVAIAERLTDVAFCIRGVSWTLTDVTQPYSFNS